MYLQLDRCRCTKCNLIQRDFADPSLFLMCKWRAIIVLVCRFCFIPFNALFPWPFALIRWTRFLGVFIRTVWL